MPTQEQFTRNDYILLAKKISPPDFRAYTVRHLK
jgi:hypothetical protein